MTLTIAYPHVRATREPFALNARRIWEIAAAARNQLVPAGRAPSLDVNRLVSRTRRLVINGMMIATQWKFDRDVRDPQGREALGVTEADPIIPGTVLISLNANVIAGREYLQRSTVAHELGHAIFDGPAILRRVVDKTFAMVTPDEKHLATKATTRDRIDWREFRANEFMGALLTPSDLLHRELVRRAISLRLKLVDTGGGKPVLGGLGDADRVEQLHLDLAERFGVSAEFIAYRLQRYGLIC